MAQQFNGFQPPPRPVTAGVRWRGWMQPQVRFCGLVGLAVLGIGAALGIAAALDWNHERRLINGGVAVDAVVQQAGEQTLAGRKQPPDSLCVLRFPWHGETHVTPGGYLAGRQEFVAPQDIVRIHVNPDDADDWTARDAPGPIAPRLLGATIALVAGLAALAIAWLYHRNVLETWRRGEAIEALVIDSRNTAIAPRSRALRCTPAREDDARVFTVYVPSRLGKLDRGDSIRVLTRAGSARGAQAAAWFEPDR